MGLSGVNLAQVMQQNQQPPAAPGQEAAFQQMVPPGTQQQSVPPQAPQQQAPQQQQTQTQQQEDDPIHQQLVAKAQQALNAKIGVKQILQNFFSGISHGMMPPSQTPQFQQQQALANLNSYESTKALVGLHQQQMQQFAPVPLVGVDQKPIVDPSTGKPITLPAAHAQTFYAGQLAAASRVQAAQIQAGPQVNTTPDMQAMGMPGQTSLRSANQAQGILQKQSASVPVDDKIRAMFPNLPAGVQSVPAASLIRAMSFMMPQTRTGFEWKETSPGTWEPLPTKAVTTRGAGGAPAAQPSAPGAASAPGSPAPTAGLPTKVFGGGPVYAFNPQTNETQLTTPQEAQQQGLTNPRKVSATNIEQDRQLNNRLADVAMKITRYEDAINTPVDAADRTFMASLLQTDKFKVALGGMELPVDKFNQLSDAITQSQLSKPAQNRLISYFNARESMLGYQRVLAGSARSSDQQLGLNLGALPGPVSPDDFAKEGIRQFKENIPIAGRGLPRIPGVPTAGDILAPKVPFNEGVDSEGKPVVYNVPATRLADFKLKHPKAVPSAR